MRKWVPDSVISAQAVGGCLINILVLKNSGPLTEYLLGWRVESFGVASALPCSGLGDLGAWELPLGISSPVQCRPRPPQCEDVLLDTMTLVSYFTLWSQKLLFKVWQGHPLQSSACLLPT